MIWTFACWLVKLNTGLALQTAWKCFFVYIVLQAACPGNRVLGNLANKLKKVIDEGKSGTLIEENI